MNPLARSAELKQEADHVLQEIRLYEILQPCGRVEPTGSYLLDVMAYPDIDLLVSRVPVERVFEIGGQLAAWERVYEVVFARSMHAELPGGLYLKPRIRYGDWGRPWKIDLWFVDDRIIDRDMVDLCRFRDAMTGHLREQIVNYKCSILTEANRTPMYSGYYICKAFIDEGLTDFQDVTRYLVENGIKME